MHSSWCMVFVAAQVRFLDYQQQVYVVFASVCVFCHVAFINFRIFLLTFFSASVILCCGYTTAVNNYKSLLISMF